MITDWSGGMQADEVNYMPLYLNLQPTGDVIR